MTDRFAAAVRRLDPRLCVGLSLFLGVSLWKMPVAAVGAAGAFLLLLTLLLGRGSEGGTGARPLLMFVLLWSGVRLGLALWDGIPMQEALTLSGEIALRLAALLLLGLTLSLAVSARRIGLALSWALRPFMGRDAWQGALAFALMVHMIPETRRNLRELRRGLSLRQGRLSLQQRLTLVPLALIRVMARSAWTRAVAVASRRLDGPEAWTGGLRWRLVDSAVGLAAAMILLPAIL